MTEVWVPLAEEPVQPVVENSAANLQNEVGTRGGPAHGLTFIHSLINQMTPSGPSQSA